MSVSLRPLQTPKCLYILFLDSPDDIEVEM